MIDHIENILEAWGKVVRGDLQDLRRVTVAQSRYGAVGGYSVGDVDGPIEVIDQRGRRSCISLDEVDLAARIVGGMDAVHADVLCARYLLVASKEVRAASVGVSHATFSRRLIAAKVEFGKRWYFAERNVKQQGVMMMVKESC